MDLDFGSVFFGVLLPLIAIVVAVFAFSLIRRRSAPAARNDERIAALEEQVRGLLYRVWTLEQHALRTVTAPEHRSAPAPEEPARQDTRLEAAPASPDASAVEQPAATTPSAAGPFPVSSAPPAAGVAASATGAAGVSAEPPAASGRRAIDLEQRIGARWTTWVGVVAILFGIAFFLKWSFENDLLGPSARVLLGIVAGICLLAAGLLLHRRRDLSYSSEGLAGLGLGVLYLSLFGAHALYGLLGPAPAFAAMCAVTALGAVVAIVSSRQITAVFALLGGLLTPVLLAVPEPDERNLFAYLLVLDLFVLAIARFRDWPGLARLAWVGTALLVAHSLAGEPDPLHPVSRLALLSALFVLFLAVPLAMPPRRRLGEIDVLLVVANAAGYFWAVYTTLQPWRPAAEAPWALALALLYRLVASDYAGRMPDDEGPAVVHEGVAWTFLTLAIPLALSARWVTLAWAVQGVVLLWVASRVSTPVAAWGGAAALLLAAVRAVVIDEHAPGEIPVWNPTFLVQLLVVAALLVGGGLAGRARSDRLRRLRGEIVQTLLWLIAALVLAAIVWREPPGLWPATLLTALLLVVGWLARSADASSWILATPVLAAVLLARVLGADDDLQARIASGALLNGPLFSRVAASLALLLVGGRLVRAGSPGRVRLGRALSAVGGLVLLYVLSVAWTRNQGAGALTTQVGLSVLWTLYAALALAWGFFRSRRIVRYAGLALLGLTALKVFYVDLSAVRTAYRILSLLVLGIVLLGVSVLYQKKGRRPAEV